MAEIAMRGENKVERENGRKSLEPAASTNICYNLSTGTLIVRAMII